MSSITPAPVRAQTPESLFRVGAPCDDGDRGVTRMRLGPWLAGPDGRAYAGAMGVLVDDAVGHRIFVGRPADCASVTTEFSLDVLTAPPWEGTGLRAESRLLHTDAEGGFAECRVLDDAGRLVAVANTWCRYIPLPADVRLPQSEADWPLCEPADKHHLFDVLQARTIGDRLVLDPSRELTNPLGMAHGGVLITGTEVAANHAVAAILPDPVTTSVRMNFLRPAPLDAELTFAAELVHRGRSVCVVRVSSYGLAGKPCTLGTVTARAGR